MQASVINISRVLLISIVKYAIVELDVERQMILRKEEIKKRGRCNRHEKGKYALLRCLMKRRRGTLKTLGTEMILQILFPDRALTGLSSNSNVHCGQRTL